MFNWFTIFYGLIIGLVVYMAYPFSYISMYGKVSNKKATRLSLVNIAIAYTIYMVIQSQLGQYIDVDWLPKEISHMVLGGIFAGVSYFVSKWMLTDKNNKDEKIEPNTYSCNVITGFALSLVGLFVAGLVCGISGLILSVIGLKETKENNAKGYGLAIAGLVISIINILYAVTMLILVALVI